MRKQGSGPLKTPPTLQPARERRPSLVPAACREPGWTWGRQEWKTTREKKVKKRSHEKRGGDVEEEKYGI